MLSPTRFLDPKSDVVFKKIFGEHPDLVKSFLNAVMPLPEEGLIDTITYLPSEQVPRILAMKNTIVDVKCTDSQGRIFIIEMQMQWTESFRNRLIFGTSKAYVQQLKSAEDYHSLCPVYGLGLINSIFDKESEDWFHHYRHVNVQHTHKILTGLELVFIELPKFKPHTVTHRRLGALWLRFLKEFKAAPQTEVPQEFLDTPELCKAVELTQESSYTLAELSTYDTYLDAVRTMKTVEIDSFLAGKEEGREEGAHQKALEIAHALLSQGLSPDTIATLTGLTPQDIANIRLIL